MPSARHSPRTKSAQKRLGFEGTVPARASPGRTHHMLDIVCGVNRRVDALGRHQAVRLCCVVLALLGDTLGSRPASAAGFLPACALQDPPPNQVYIYENFNFQSPCSALSLGPYPYPGQVTGGFGIGDERMSAVKVGANVRLRMFQDADYKGAYAVINGGYKISALSYPWNDSVSSLRVENNARSPHCDDLRPGEFALFSDINLTGDCVVWQYGQTLDTIEALGIANDSVSSLNPGPNVSCPAYDVLTLYSDVGESGSTLLARSGGNPFLDLRNNSFNDATSSLSSIKVCATP
jgi:hypothetical protein